MHFVRHHAQVIGTLAAAAEDEWMYQIANQESQPHAKHDKDLRVVFEQLRTGVAVRADWEQVLSNLESSQDKEIERVSSPSSAAFSFPTYLC